MPPQRPPFGPPFGDQNRSKNGSEIGLLKKSPQDRPKTAQDRPKRPPGPPRSTQDAPPDPQDRPKTAPGQTKTTSRPPTKPQSIQASDLQRSVAMTFEPPSLRTSKPPSLYNRGPAAEALAFRSGRFPSKGPCEITRGSLCYSFKECYIRFLRNLRYFRTESTGDGPRLCRRTPASRESRQAQKSIKNRSKI